MRGYMCSNIFCGQHLLFEVLAYCVTLGDEVREYVDKRLEYLSNAFTTGKAAEILGNTKETMFFHRVSCHPYWLKVYHLQERHRRISRQRCRLRDRPQIRVVYEYHFAFYEEEMRKSTVSP